MNFLISSYRRCGKVTTIDALKRVGAKEKDIVIGTQTDEDYEAYREEYPDCNIVKLDGVHNLAGNRNGLMDYCKERGIKYGVLMDDDILDLDIKSGKSIYDELEDDISVMQREDVIACDWAPIDVVLDCDYMKDFPWSMVFIVVDMERAEHVDCSFEICEDTEWLHRILHKGGHLLFKINAFVTVMPLMSNDGTGCSDSYSKSDKVELWKRLSRMYPELMTCVTIDDMGQPQLLLWQELKMVWLDGRPA